MQRHIQNLNLDWFYFPFDLRDPHAANDITLRPVRVTLPHTNIELPYHNFSEKEFCFVSTYRKSIKIPTSLRHHRLYLDFDGVMTAATLYINGQQAGPEHRGGYTPFSYEITPLIRCGEINLIEVRVDSTERADIPPFGGTVDYLTFGGIYRDVHLRAVAPIHIQNLFVRPGDVLNSSKQLAVDVHIANTEDQPKNQLVTVTLCSHTGHILRLASEPVYINARSEKTVTVSLSSLTGIHLWDIENPVLYEVRASLGNGDTTSTRFGFRHAEFRGDGVFYLNGEPLKLRGLNRHQTYPYIGAAAPARLQRKDADILKTDLACNVVRASHYPQSPHFLDRCDEIGLLVFEEIPGWQYIGDRAWQDLSLRDVEAMIMRDRNHPSIILWGVRINESADNHEFYMQTNALAHHLDPTRQTGGVRAIWGSELLEDVYTMNDFDYDLKAPTAPRYLNTEFCGHMFPTKSFDQEERVQEHALRHARIHNLIGGMKSAGGIGWCAFDYNTHACFGSGDRICYHGVLDIFRQPKFAAHFYASQISPAKRIVLEPASYWKIGDRNGSSPEQLLIFSNVEEIEIHIGDAFHSKVKADRSLYPNLIHPPFFVRDIGSLWGQSWKPVRITGFIAGLQVAERIIANDGLPTRLQFTADDTELHADGADMTRLSLRITDDYGNILPFASQPVTVTIQGPGQLVGDNPCPMPGGRGALYIRSTCRAGNIILTATTPRLPAQQLTLTTHSAIRPLRRRKTAVRRRTQTIPAGA